MARRLVLLTVLAISLGLPVWMGRTQVEAQPSRPAPAAATLPACKSEVGRLKQELSSTRDALSRARAAEADARAELEKLRTAERERLRRLEQQTGVAADKLR